MSEKRDREGHLWALVRAWRAEQDPKPSQTWIAGKVGISRSALTEWKYGRNFGGAEALRALARLIGQPYTTVLEAALRDRGYLDGTIVKPGEAAQLLEAVLDQTPVQPDPQPRQEGRNHA